ncbi:50S ribosomal protein L24 [Candidatus Parcubacteria bacterium]|nr:MAG: 50S ribosomal protein L24 [Candidatus Parcubacteria bacterium]
MPTRLKIKTGDTVQLLSGKERGKRGKVIGAFPRTGLVVVEGLNLKKRHRRSRRQDKKGEIVLIPGPVQSSAVAVVCPKCSKPARIGYQLAEGGRKLRVCNQCRAAF